LPAGFRKCSRMPISSSQAWPATPLVRAAERCCRLLSAANRAPNASRTSLYGHLRAKIPQLQAALEGQVRDHHRFLLQSLLRQLYFIETEIELLDARLEQLGQQHEDLAEALNRWVTVPGVDRVAAWSFIAEMGADVSQFPTAAHLDSWAGVCPGNNERAGKRISSKIRKDSPWLRRMACQSAWAAARTKNTYLSAQFKKLAARRRRKCAIIAVAHSILVIGYYLQLKRCAYTDLGGNYFDSTRTG
jgi:transposase